MKKDKKSESAALLRQKAEESIKECEERYRTLFEVIDEGFCVVEMIYDPDGKVIDYRFVEINPAFEKITGLQQALGKTIRQMVPNLDMHWFEIYGKVARTGESIRFEAPPTARQRYYNIFAFRISGDGSQRVGILFNDITERKKIEGSLRKELDFSRNLTETAQAIILVLDTNGKIVHFNPYMEEISGYKLEEVVGKDWFITFMPENDQKKIHKLFFNAIRGIQTRGNVNPIITKDKKQLFIEWYDKTLKDINGNIVGLLSIGRDITERKRAEEDLRKSEEKYRTLTENVNLGIYRNTVGPEGKFIEANPAIIGMFGYKSKKEFLAVNVSDLYQNQEDRNNFNNKILKEGFVRNKELGLKKKDGSLIIGSVSAVAVNDEQGNVKYYDGIIDDITERKQMLEKTQFLAHTIESILEIVTITDLEDRLIFVNHSFCDIYGYTNEEIIGQHVKILSSPNNPPELLKDILEHSHKDSWKGELLNLTKAGREFPIFLQTSQIINEKGKIIGLVGISKDITEHKRAEEVLQKSEVRFRELFNRMSSGVAVYEVVDNGGDFIFRDFNPAAEKIEKVSRKDIFGKRVSETFPGVKAFGVVEVFQRVWQTGKPEYYPENIYKDEKNSESWRETWVFKLPTGEIVAIYNDITERKRAEEDLRKSEEKYRTLTENVNLGIYRNTVGPEGKFIEANSAIIGMFGYKSKKEFLAVNVSDLYQNQEDRNNFNDKLLKEGFVRNKELRLKKKDGSLIVGSVSAVAVNDEQGYVKYYDGIIDDITEHKRAEEELNKQKDLLQTVIDNIPVMITYFDESGKIQLINNDVVKNLGWTFEEWKTEDIYSKCYPDPEYLKYVHDFMSRKSKNWLDFKTVTKDGKVIDTSWINILLPNGISMGIGQNITERKRVEEALQESEGKLKKAQEIGKIGNWEYDVITEDIKWSEQVFVLFERDIELGPPTEAEEAKNYTEKQAKILKDLARQCIKTGLECQIDIDPVLPSGRRVHYASTLKPVKDENGKVIKLLGIIQDITERKQAESQREAALEALKKSNQLLRDTGAMAQIGGWELDLSTQEVSWTEEVGRIHGVEPGYRLKLEEAINFYVPEFRPALEAGLKKAAETGEPYDLESHFIPQSSKDWIWVRSLGRAVYSDGKITKLAGTFQNIDKYKRVEVALQVSLEKYRVLFESFPLGITISNKSGMIIEGNRQSEKLLGITLKEHVERRIDSKEWQIIRKDGTPMPADEYASSRALRENRPINNAEMGIVNDKGEITWINVTAAPIPLKDYGVAITYNDITERRKAEEDLLKSRKELELLNIHLHEIKEEERASISRELHDELGQSLTAVKMDLSSIRENTGDIKSVTPKLDKTLKMVDGIIKDVQRISSELRPGILDDLGLTPAIEWYCEEFEARTGIKCELNLEEIRIKNPQKKTGLYRILQESLTNIARHSEAKNVIVRLEQIKEDINLVIRDDGIGIPEEKMESNRSLGLIGIRERIKQFNGRIDIESVKDKGTEIRVRVPFESSE